MPPFQHKMKGDLDDLKDGVSMDQFNQLFIAQLGLSTLGIWLGSTLGMNNSTTGTYSRSTLGIDMASPLISWKMHFLIYSLAPEKMWVGPA